MNELVSTLLVNSAVFSVLFGAMLLVRKLFAGRMSAVLRYALWATVAVKLLLPFGFESSLSPLGRFADMPAQASVLSAPPVSRDTPVSLVLLFADMPFLSPGTPYYLSRIDRKTWLAGQALYIVLATLLYMAFILVSTSVICMRDSFIGNMWSETAAILGYSGAGRAVALPALVKTLEMSTPYECMAIQACGEELQVLPLGAAAAGVRDMRVLPVLFGGHMGIGTAGEIAAL